MEKIILEFALNLIIKSFAISGKMSGKCAICTLVN